jgi:serine protease
MAGIIASQWGDDVAAATGVIRSGTRTAGIGPGLRILPVRALGKCGGTSSDVIDGMRWAAGLPASASGQTWASLGIQANANPANVINLSLGGSVGACSASYAAVVQEITARGVTIVAATGNDTAVGVLQPANCPGVIAVTAHVINGDNADYANIGPQVAISAPGGGAPTQLATNPALLPSDNAYLIWSTGLFGSTTPTSTVSSTDTRSGDALLGLTGTSPATPHVSAAVALMLAASPTSLTPANVRGFLAASARPHPPGTYCATGQAGAGLCGAGLLDVGAALTLVLPTAPATLPAPPALVPIDPPPPPPSSGGGGGSLPLWPVLLVFALGLAREVRRRA